MKILIADDSAFMRTILKSIIPTTKFPDAEIIEAADGKEAVEKYNQEHPDLILLDIIMPVKGGIDVLKEIGMSAKSIVMISSIDEQKVIDEATSLGAKGYIVKPYDSSEVVEMINSLGQ
jgi:two-component system chemotaxis response regulator CheY